jgi:hypothetical protein
MAGESSCGDNTGQASASNTTFESGIYSTRTKRARYDPDERSSTTMPLLDGINIVDDDSVHPRFLKLINNSKQDLAFNGWILKRKVGSQSFEFKFPRGMILRAGATTTVNNNINSSMFDRTEANVCIS